MLRLTTQLVFAAALAFASVSCKGSKKPALKPGELSEAQRADLRKKALENYKKLVERYPDSPFASQAEERVRALTPQVSGKK